MKNSLSTNEPMIYIKVNIVKNNAAANGSETNIVIATTEDANGNIIGNIDVVFKTDGNALFRENQLPTYRVTTDAEGLATVNIINDSEKNEINTVSICVFNNPEQSKKVNVKFHKTYKKFEISSVININHTLESNQPTIAWAGASFSIVTHGGSEDISWAIQGEESGIILTTDGKKIATVEIVNEPRGPRLLVCEDNITGEFLIYTFEIKYFLLHSEHPNKYRFILEEMPAIKMQDRIIYNELFKQWGKMSSYIGWGMDEEYWTSEHNNLFARVYNLDTGRDREIAIDLHSLNYIFNAVGDPY